MEQFRFIAAALPYLAHPALVLVVGMAMCLFAYSGRLINPAVLVQLANPLGLAIDPHNPYRAAQGLEHDHLLGGHHLPQGPVNMQGVGLRLGAQRRPQLARTAHALAILAWPPGLAWGGLGARVEGGSHPQPREELRACTQLLAQRLDHASDAKGIVHDTAANHAVDSGGSSSGRSGVSLSVGVGLASCRLLASTPTLASETGREVSADVIF